MSQIDLPSKPDLKKMADAIRVLTVDAVHGAASGHQGMPMGMADVAAVLYTQFLKFNPADPDWPDRDRFVLSAGHGSMLLYSLLHLTGYEDFSLEQLKAFRQLGAFTAGHPEFGHGRGVETTTGPLGQGFATAVGMALAERHLNSVFGDDLVDHRTYVLASDGDLMEGVSHEAAALAGHLKLSKLIVLFDDNKITIDGPTSLTDSTDVPARFRAYGWQVSEIDGHDPDAIAGALKAAQNAEAPVLICCRTTIGYGSPGQAGTSAVHGYAIKGEEVDATREQLGWAYPPFEVPSDIRELWQAAGERSRSDYEAWKSRLTASDTGTQAEFARRIAGDLPTGLSEALAAHKEGLTKEPKSIATRAASELALNVVNEIVPDTIGGSADLTGSNNTRTKSLRVLTEEDYGGRFLHYGIREHGMAAAMNGMALHGGVIPYSGTFLVFSDYARPAIRLSALMGARAVYVMTHDSIGLGEDGPTHQPVEHLAALRAMPNLHVLRPADAVETAECWELALGRTEGPSLLALTRQGVPLVRTEHTSENRSANGAYILSDAPDAKVTLIGTGSEVAIALEAHTQLAGQGIATRVVSMPCWELFDALPLAERQRIIDPNTVRVAVEAASPLGWERYVGESGAIVGIESFGASAPYKTLYEHFGVTAQAVVRAAQERL